MKYFIGVELGVNNMIAGIVDKYGRLVRKDSIPTGKDREYGEIIKDMAQLIKNVLKDEDVDIKNVRYIGVGCPGIPDNKTGTIVRNYTLNFINMPVRAELHKYFNLPVHVENDANCAALAESVAGAAEDIRFSALIRIGNGIGGGIIINDKIYSGFNFAGAELGHMCIAMGGEKCTCGRLGCWESYASATALIRQTREAAQKHPDSLINTIIDNDPSKITVFTAFEAAKQGDAAGSEVARKYLFYLGEGITNIVNILMPNAIIIGGEISKMGEHLLKPLRDIVYGNMYAHEVEKPEFKTAELGSAAIVIGAAMSGMYKDGNEIACEI